MSRRSSDVRRTYAVLVLFLMRDMVLIMYACIISVRINSHSTVSFVKTEQSLASLHLCFFNFLGIRVCA